MPDWIIHIGAAHALGRPFGRWDPRWLFLGAVLPDAVPRVFSQVLHLVPALDSLSTVWVGLHVGFLHTPASVALAAAALAVMAADRAAAALGLAFGSALHFALDVLQKSWGGGTALLFPVDLRPISLQVVWYDSAVPHALVIAFGLYLLVVWRRSSWPVAPAFARCTWPRALAAAGLALAYLLAPLACLDRAVAENVGNSKMMLEPAAFAGHRVELPVVEVEGVDGDDVLIEWDDVPYPISWRGRPAVEPGDFISLRGAFTGSRIEPAEVFVHDYGFKTLASLLGLAMLVAVWAPSRRHGSGLWRSAP
jgi:hypothetical protein